MKKEKNKIKRLAIFGFKTEPEIVKEYHNLDPLEKAAILHKIKKYLRKIILDELRSNQHIVQCPVCNSVWKKKKRIEKYET